MNETCAVAVVGGGPVGMMAGIQLGKLGLDVVIFERWPNRYPQPRACGLHHDALRVIQSIADAREVEPLFEQAIGKGRSYVFRNAADEILLEIDWNKPGESGWAEVSTFYQPDLEDLFESKLLELPNVQVNRGWEVESVSQTAEAATVVAREASGERGDRRRVTADWVIGADGANSMVRAAMGAEVVDLGFAYDWLVIDTIPHEEREWWPYLEQRCDPARPTTSVPSGPGGHRRWEFMLLPGEDKEEMSSAAACWRLLEPWGFHPGNTDLVRHTVYTFNARWTEPWRRGRLLLAGDSAHLMPPFLGQGLGSGLRDARALAWRLGLVDSGVAPAEILDSYGPERLGHVRQIIQEAVALGEIICVLEPAAAAERDRQMIAAYKDPSLAPPPPPPWRLGPGAIRTDDPLAGLLGVQGRVAVDGRTGLLDDLIGAGFTLISPREDPASLLGEISARMWKELDGRSVHVGPDGEYEDLDGTYREWFDSRGIELVLVRPDFHVFGSAADVGEADRLVAELGGSLRLPAFQAR